MAARDRHDLGIVFVHGIGEHEPGSTLHQMGAQFARAVGELDPAAVVEERTDDIIVETGGQSWKVAEANWDVTFEEPGFFETVRWLVLVAPWILQREALYWHRRRRREEIGAKSAFGEFWNTWLSQGFWIRLAVAMFVAPLAQLAALGLALFRFVPRVGRLIRSILVGVLGDAYKFVTNPEDTERMTAAVRATLAEIGDDADAVMIVAHSQGSAVALDALAAGPPPNFRRLVTLGAGVGKLYALRQLAGRSVFLAVWSILRIGALVAMVAGFASATTGDFEATVAIVALLIGAAAPNFGSRVGRRRAAEAIAASPGFGTQWTWLDCWSRWDLVPDGTMRAPTRTVGNAVLSLEVANQAKPMPGLRKDHVTYLENTDQVIPLLYVAAREAAASELPHPYVPLVGMVRINPEHPALLSSDTHRSNVAAVNELISNAGLGVDAGSLPAVTARAHEQFPIAVPEAVLHEAHWWHSGKLWFAIVTAGFVAVTAAIAPTIFRALGAEPSEFVEYNGELMARTQVLAEVVMSFPAAVWLLLAVVGMSASLYYLPERRALATLVSVVLAGAAIGGMAWGLSFAMNTVVAQQDLAPGECAETELVIGEVAIGTDAVRLPCDEPHDSQLVATAPVDFVATEAQVINWCDQALEDLLDDEPFDTYLRGGGDLYVLWPGSEESLEESQAAYCFWVTDEPTMSSAVSFAMP